MSGTARPWYHWETGGLRLEISAQTGSDRDAANGIHGGRLRLRVAAPPVDGKANRRLLDWLAGEFKVAKNRVRLLRGEHGRSKSLLILAPCALPGWFNDLGGRPGRTPG